MEERNEDIIEHERGMRKLHKYISDTLLKNLKVKTSDKEMLKNPEMFSDAPSKEETNSNMKQISQSLQNLHASIIRADDGKEIVVKM